MKIRMLTTVAEEGRVLEAGEEYELDTVEAKDLCARPADMPRAEPVAVRRVEKAERRVKRPAEVR
jgi:hypothetical protein